MKLHSHHGNLRPTLLVALVYMYSNFLRCSTFWLSEL